MKHHFHGYIAGLSVLLGENEKPEVLACLHKCKETLEVPSVKLLEPGMELMTNSGQHRSPSQTIIFLAFETNFLRPLFRSDRTLHRRRQQDEFGDPHPESRIHQFEGVPDSRKEEHPHRYASHVSLTFAYLLHLHI